MGKIPGSLLRGASIKQPETGPAYDRRQGMITREHIKNAIDQIAGRDYEVGYALEKMLAAGQIDSAPETNSQSTSDFYFLFQNRKVPIRAHQFFNEGTVPLEERLLINYGELAERQIFLEKGAAQNYREAALNIHEAGLRFLIDHEVDYALARCRQKLEKARPPQAGRLNQTIEILGSIKDGSRPLFEGVDLQPPWMKGMVDRGTPSYFLPLPLNNVALMQIAEINLDFFNIRFLLDTLIKGAFSYLFAAVVDKRIAGLMYLVPHHSIMKQDLEIKYIATVRGRRWEPGEIRYHVPRGVGSILVAGGWILWKNQYPRGRRLWLESELGAVHFYKSLGFIRKSGYHYYLDHPRGYLLKNILVMSRNSAFQSPEFEKTIEENLFRQIKHLARVNTPEKRTEALELLEESLNPDMPESIQMQARDFLISRAKTWLETRSFSFAGSLFPQGDLHRDAPLLVVWHDFYGRHLENLFHLENPKRLEAIRSVLDNQDISKAWDSLTPHPITLEELAWVHEKNYLDLLADTAGGPLYSFDIDTQASERSFEVICLAVGGLFGLLDEIWNGAARQGFAFIRPPGHHARPGQAMGYCLVNNAALGAQYLIRRHKASRIMIVDIDAHHGNGTQEAFYDDNRVLYFSFHQFPIFPGTGRFGEVGQGKGEGFTVNVPLPSGQDDRTFARILHHLVRPLARAYKPEIILVSCGFDNYFRDPTSQMKGTAEGYAWMTAILQGVASEVCQGKICFILEGGYSYKGLLECGLATMQVLCMRPSIDKERLLKALQKDPSPNAPLGKAIEVHRKYWNLF